MNSLVSSIIFLLSISCTTIDAQDPAIYWSDYPPCEDNCHQSVWATESCSLPNSCSCSGCLCLANSCLCETSSWLIAVAQCIGEQCGSSAVTDAAYVAQSACAGNGYGLAVPSAELVSIGLAAIPTISKVVQTTNSPVIISVPQSTTVTPTVIVTAVASTLTDQPTTPTLATLTNPTASANSVTTSSSTSSSIPVASTSSALTTLSTGAKAGIGIGTTLGVVIIFCLLGLLLMQHNKYTRLKKAQVAAEPTSTSGPSEVDGLGVVGAVAGDVKDGKRKSELNGVGVSPVGPMSKPEAAGSPEKAQLLDVLEMPAPLSIEEKQELERRRRAAELSGNSRDIPVEVGDRERSELEARRKFYELA